MRPFKTLNLFLAFMAGVPCLSATMWGRMDQDLTISPVRGPVTVTGDFLIPRGITLTLEAGSVLRIQASAGGQETVSGTPNTDISVEGTIRSKGTADNPVVIQSATRYQWGAVYFAPGSGGSLQYTNIQGGKVVVNGSRPIIQHCNILEGGGLEIAHRAAPTVRGNNIYYNNVGVRIWVDTAGGVIRDNNIVQNQHGVYVDGFREDRLVISDNNIHNNKEYDLVNRSPNKLSVPSNYWGVLDPSELSSKIYDQSDDSSLGPVDALPLRIESQSMTWSLPVKPDAAPPPRVRELVFQEPTWDIRPPVGFFQSAHRRLGVRLIPGIVFPMVEVGKFSYSPEFHLSAEFRLVYDDSKNMGLEFFGAKFTSPSDLPDVEPEESSTFSWWGVGLRGEYRPLSKKLVSPFVSVGGALHRLSVNTTFFKDQQAKKDLDSSGAAESNIGLSLGLGASLIHQKVVEVQALFRYHFIQRNATSTGEGQDSAQFAVAGLSLVKYF